MAFQQMIISKNQSKRENNLTNLNNLVKSGSIKNFSATLQLLRSYLHYMLQAEFYSLRSL